MDELPSINITIDGGAAAQWVLVLITFAYATITFFLAIANHRSAKAEERSLLWQRMPAVVPSNARPLSATLRLRNVGSSTAYAVAVKTRVGTDDWTASQMYPKGALGPGNPDRCPLPWPDDAGHDIAELDLVTLRAEYQSFTGELFATERIYKRGSASLKTYRFGRAGWLGRRYGWERLTFLDLPDVVDPTGSAMIDGDEAE